MDGYCGTNSISFKTTTQFKIIIFRTTPPPKDTNQQIQNNLGPPPAFNNITYTVAEKNNAADKTNAILSSCDTVVTSPPSNLDITQNYNNHDNGTLQKCKKTYL